MDSYYGLEERDSKKPGSQVRDSRNGLQKFLDNTKEPKYIVLNAILIIIFSFSFPEFVSFMFIPLIIFYILLKRHKKTLLLKMPTQAHVIDPNEKENKGSSPGMAQGILFLGNSLEDNSELWATNSDSRTHFLILGTTGAGKTERLLGFCANALSWASGCLYCDGKGDTGLFVKMYLMARRFGREDDLLLINYMTGNQDVGSRSGKLLSNTLNPFSTGSSDSLTQMLVSLMESGSNGGGGGDMWKGRATSMLTGVVRALCFLRDMGRLELNVNEIRNYISLKAISELATGKQYSFIPQKIRTSLEKYLSSLPGYDASRGDKQGQTTMEQHGYLEMQFTRLFGSLADVYGHIFADPSAEVDIEDVVLSKRILVIMLPALEKSPDEIANLGKIITATLKGMMGKNLGSEVEGSYEDLIMKKPTLSNTPFICILDEVGYYTVDGLAIVAAQSRSLGFSMIYASQDIVSMRRLHEKEADSIIANTNFKEIMKTVETAHTGKLAVELGDKGYRVETGGYEYDDNGNLKGSKSMSYRETNRVSLLDLADQGLGEMHMYYRNKVIRASGFSPLPELTYKFDIKKDKIRPNHFIRVPKPSSVELDYVKVIPKITSDLLLSDFQILIEEETKNFINHYTREPDETINFVKYFREKEINPTNMSKALSRVIFEIKQNDNDYFSRLRSEDNTGFNSDRDNENDGEDNDDNLEMLRRMFGDEEAPNPPRGSKDNQKPKKPRRHKNRIMANETLEEDKEIEQEPDIENPDIQSAMSILSENIPKEEKEEGIKKKIIKTKKTKTRDDIIEDAAKKMLEDFNLSDDEEDK